MITIGEALSKAEELGKRYNPTGSSLYRAKRYYGADTSLSEWNNQATGVAGTVNNVREWFETNSEPARNDFDSDDNSVNEPESSTPSLPTPDNPSSIIGNPVGSQDGTDSSNTSSRAGIVSNLTGVATDKIKDTYDQFKSGAPGADEVTDAYRKIATGNASEELEERFQDAYQDNGFNPQDIIPEFGEFSGVNPFPEGIQIDTGFEEASNNLVKITKILVGGSLGAAALYFLTQRGDKE